MVQRHGQQLLDGFAVFRRDVAGATYVQLGHPVGLRRLLSFPSRSWLWTGGLCRVWR